MNSSKIVLIALLAIIASSQGYFTGFNLDQDLASATERSMSNLRGLLTVFSCRANT